MKLACARLGCGHQAAASVLFNASESKVVIVDLGDMTVGIPLCGHHTRTRTPPQGWTMVDDRTDPVQTPLWLDNAPPPVELGPDDRPPVRRPVDRGFVWERHLDKADQDHTPTTPLLSRAFRSISDN